MVFSRSTSGRSGNGGDAGSVAVIGLGRFGQAVALELEAEGTEVLGIDADGKLVQQMAGDLTHLVEADATNEEAMRQLGVHELDKAVIGVGHNLEASLLIASVLVTLGIGDVWAKAISHAHARILGQIGVHHVVRPEHEMGQRVAHLVRGGMLDYIEFDDGYALVKTTPPDRVLDKPLGESRVRSEFGITVVGIKRAGEDFTHATPETVVHHGDQIIVSGPRDQVERFSNLS